MKIVKPTATRQSRFFKKDDLWYFSTREGIDIGPFDSKEEASEGASVYLDFISSEPNKTAEEFVRLKVVGE